MLDFFILMFYLGIIAIYVASAFALFLLIQLISYKILHFNLYKWAIAKLGIN